MEENRIVLRETPHTYRTEIPNCVDDMGLSPYAFRLYARIKRRAGDEGVCYESAEHLAEACKMSTGSVSNAKEELEKAGLIEIASRERKNGGYYHEVVILDIWGKNFAKYKPPSPGEGAPSPHEGAPSPGETKKNPIKNINPIKNNTISAVAETQYEPFNNEADMPQSFVDEYTPRKSGKTRDPRYKHIAYSVYYSVIGRKPSKEMIDDIITVFGENPDVELVRECRKAWIQRGYSPVSYNWIYWYRDGIPEFAKKSGEPKGFRPVSENSDLYDVIQR